MKMHSPDVCGLNSGGVIIMDYLGCILIRLRGFLSGFKLPKIVRHPVLFDARHPFSGRSFLHPVRRGSIVSSVGVVLRSRSEAQIRNAVVAPVSIDVVNRAIWPLAVVKHPRGVVCLQNLLTKKPALPVSLIFDVKSWFARVLCVPRFHGALRVFATSKPLNSSRPPSQATRFRVVGNKAADCLNKHGLFILHGMTIPRCAIGARRM